MRFIQNKSAWAAVIGSAALLAGSACMNGNTAFTSVAPAPPAAQTAAAVNYATAIAVSAVNTPLPSIPPSYEQTFYGSAAAQQASTLNQFFNPTYDITGTGFTGQLTLNNITQQLTVSVMASNVKSRPQFSIQGVGGAPYFSNTLNTNSNILVATFVSLISPNQNAVIVPYQFSVIDTGAAPNGVSYTVTISIQ